MSNVRLSNGSPTLERMDARLSEQPKPSACRSLFGPVDHEELKRELKGHLSAMEEASAEAWNFDFASFTPRPNGRYLWMTVDSTDLPSFYSTSECKAKNVCSSGNSAVDLNGNHDVCGLAEESAERAEAERREQHGKGQRKRSAACLDSSCQVKRSHTCLDEVSCRPAVTQTVDHTPKKSSPQRQT